MKIMLLGSPGVGKGTQAALICEKFNIPAISTGNILRAAAKSNSELGQLAKSYLDQGKLVPDEVINAVVIERLSQPDCQAGFLLDGFPRTINQAETLIEHQIQLDYVIVLDVADQEIIKRLSGRRTHIASGRTYHIDYNPPKHADIDDLTGEPLVQREDDREVVISKRLEVYREQTAPLINFYQNLAQQQQVKFVSISGLGSVEAVHENILSYLEDDIK